MFIRGIKFIDGYLVITFTYYLKNPHLSIYSATLLGNMGVMFFLFLMLSRIKVDEISIIGAFT